jgi:hypothetical protein
MKAEQITEKLNKMNKTQLINFAWNYTKGGIFNSWKKKDLVKYLSNKMIIDLRDEKLNKILS